MTDRKKLSTLLAGMAILLGSAPAHGAIEHILPKPQQVTTSTGPGFALNRAVALTDATQNPELLRVLAEAGLTVGSGGAAVTVEIAPIPGAYDYTLAEYPAEAYSITVSRNAIAIKAATEMGVTRAAQTLRQMAMDCDGVIEASTITDWPAFKLRGFMQDVGRSFLSVDELKREIDLLSRFKVNTFHWHLTDITGWRLEIKAYPQLTSNTAITRFPGKYYTQAQAREIQDYAHERSMTVIPEIDMPGHANPFERAMGHNMQTAEGIAELKVILKEVAELFDKAPYIHIGGDEVSFPDSYIIDMINYVHGLGKKVVIWNQYNRPSKTVDPNVIPCDLTTNWATAGRISPGVPNIDMRYNYTNHFDVFADLAGIYRSSIFDVQQGNPDVAGTISAAWSDTFTPTEDDILRQNNIYANVIASAERAWIGGGREYIERGGAYLPTSGPDFEDFADFERRFLYHKNTTLASAKHQIPYVRQTDITWRITDQIPNGGNAAATLAPEQHLNDDVMPTTFNVNGTNYSSAIYAGAGIYLRHIWHGTVKGIFANPQNNMTAYAWTYIHSDKEQDAGAFIEFYTYSRSGNEKAPDAGNWDRRGSRIWLNGQEIKAPTWSQPGKNITQNQATEGLANENFTARPPMAIHLKKGWNKVFLKLPHVNSGGTGRDKWQMTFVVVDPQGNDALDGIIYSPNRTLDVEAEALIAALDEMNAWRNANISDVPGFYPASIAKEYDAIVEEITATLADELSADERRQQRSDLTKAYAAMTDAAAKGEIAQPQESVVYTLSTPLRGSRFATGKGAGQDMYGETTASDASNWTFKLRADGSYDIVNAADGTFVSPESAYNSALKTVAAKPSAGWLVKPADEGGYTIIVSGDKQWNQTNGGQNFRIYNWGSGSNTTDTGCKYRFAIVDAPEPVEPGVDTSNPELLLLDVDLSNGPFRINDSDAAAILAHQGAQTIAIDATTESHANRAVLISACTDDGSGSHFSVFTENNGFGVIYTGLQNNQEGWYTRKVGGTGRHRYVVVISDEIGFKYYVDGSSPGDGTLSPSALGQYGVASLGRANGGQAIYIGGSKNTTNQKVNHAGQIHSVRLYNRALSDDEVRNLQWDALTTAIDNVTVDSLDNSALRGIFDLQGRRIEGPLAPGLYIIDGHKTLIR